MTLTRWRAAPAITALFTQANLLAPDRYKEADGIIGDTAHSSRTSDHNPAPDGFVYAGDLSDDDEAGIDCREIARQIVERRDRRVKYLISEGRMVRSYPLLRDGRVVTPAWTWTTYSGPNGHFKHLHVSVLAAWRNDTSPWWVPPAPPAEPAQEDDDMYQLLETTDTKRLYALSPAGLDHIQTMDQLVGLARIGAFRQLDKNGNPTSRKVTQADVDQALAVFA